MKKLVFFFVIYFSILNNFDALSLKTNNSNYFVNINNSIYRFKKIINIENNEALFNLKYDNYNNLNDYEISISKTAKNILSPIFGTQDLIGKEFYLHKTQDNYYKSEITNSIKLKIVGESAWSSVNEFTKN